MCLIFSWVGTLEEEEKNEFGELVERPTQEKKRDGRTPRKKRKQTLTQGKGSWRTEDGRHSRIVGGGRGTDRGCPLWIQSNSYHTCHDDTTDHARDESRKYAKSGGVGKGSKRLA